MVLIVSVELLQIPQLKIMLHLKRKLTANYKHPLSSPLLSPIPQNLSTSSHICVNSKLFS